MWLASSTGSPVQYRISFSSWQSAWQHFIPKLSISQLPLINVLITSRDLDLLVWLSSLYKAIFISSRTYNNMFFWRSIYEHQIHDASRSILCLLHLYFYKRRRKSAAIYLAILPFDVYAWRILTLIHAYKSCGCRPASSIRSSDWYW